MTELPEAMVLQAAKAIHKAQQAAMEEANRVLAPMSSRALDEVAARAALTAAGVTEMRALLVEARGALLTLDDVKNNDEMGGCIECDGAYPGYAGGDPEDHHPGCGYLVGSAIAAKIDAALQGSSHE